MHRIRGKVAIGFAISFSLLAMSFVVARASSASSRRENLSSFACGGSVERRLWALWDGGIRDAIRTDLIENRLLVTGDTYALYDLQTILSNLVAMSDRCGRNYRLSQLADLLLPVYQGLETLPRPYEHHRGWICRGGSLCTKANRRFGKEVQLVSLQGLGLLTDLAARMFSKTDVTLQRHPFVGLTAMAAQGHLERMATPALRDSLRRRIRSKPTDVKGNSSSLLFTSFDIWRFTIAINTATLRSESWQPSKSVRTMVRGTAHLFAKRTILDRSSSTPKAILDAHYWDGRVDHAYAGYQGAVSPVKCVGNAGQFRPVARKPLIPRQPVFGMGWDISHSRRLVPLFDAVARLGSQALSTYRLPSGLLPSERVRSAYANQLADVIWNQDHTYPLFANYWGGANGWYRVAYNSGNGSCRIGNPPFGLTSAFPQGGFVVWTAYKPLLGELGVSLFRRSSSTLRADHEFIRKYYPQLAVSDDSRGAKQYGKLQFWSSFVGVSNLSLLFLL